MQTGPNIGSRQQMLVPWHLCLHIYRWLCMFLFFVLFQPRSCHSHCEFDSIFLLFHKFLILFTQLLYSFHKITNNMKTGQATAIIHTYMYIFMHINIGKYYQQQ